MEDRKQVMGGDLSPYQVTRLKLARKRRFVLDCLNSHYTRAVQEEPLNLLARLQMFDFLRD